MTQAETRPATDSFQFSLRESLALVTIVVLAFGWAVTVMRLRSAETELNRLRAETGYLSMTEPGQIAAARLPSDQPLTYRLRVRVPKSSQKFRVAYSSVWPAEASHPSWYGAVPVAAGESIVVVRIMEDPRDGRWKISAMISTLEGDRRMATSLPPDQATIFRGSHEVISTGIPRTGTIAANQSESIRLLDEKWLVGEGSLLLYGDRLPEHDQVGIYAELQPDAGPL